MFTFKQFTIQQDHTAMKVGTDACVLGAYADVQGERILDIGTGTGLLALMAAQRNPTALIDAVEIDEDAARQARQNVASSPFANRVRVLHTRIQGYRPESSGNYPLEETDSTLTFAPPLPDKAMGPGGAIYDRILTNPPFYTNHLLSPDAAVNRALHTGDLSFEELLESVVRLLKKDGQWWVLLPPYEAGQLEKLARQMQLEPFQRLYLRHNDQKPVFRVVTGFRYGAETSLKELLDVYETTTTTPAGKLIYTDAFATLLKSFYLIF